MRSQKRCNGIEMQKMPEQNLTLEEKRNRKVTLNDYSNNTLG